jgi:hypothetical protein
MGSGATKPKADNSILDEFSMFTLQFLNQMLDDCIERVKRDKLSKKIDKQGRIRK